MTQISRGFFKDLHCRPTAGVGQLNSSSAYSKGLQSGVPGSVGSPETLSETKVDGNYFNNNTKKLFTFSFLFFF